MRELPIIEIEVGLESKILSANAIAPWGVGQPGPFYSAVVISPDEYESGVRRSIALVSF